MSHGSLKFSRLSLASHLRRQKRGFPLSFRIDFPLVFSHVLALSRSLSLSLALSPTLFYSLLLSPTLSCSLLLSLALSCSLLLSLALSCSLLLSRVLSPSPALAFNLLLSIQRVHFLFRSFSRSLLCALSRFRVFSFQRPFHSLLVSFSLFLLLQS